MNVHPIFFASWLLLLLLVIPLVLGGIDYFLLHYWVKMRRGASILTALATAICAGALGAWRCHELSEGARGSFMDEEMALHAACAAFLVLFAVPFGLKLYRSWTGIHVGPAEKSPGAEGVKAWLSPGNLIVAALIAGCAAGAYDVRFLGMFALLVGCLLIQPLMNSVSSPEPAPAAAPALGGEREKVLSLLEAGKITAEESAELLNALGSGTSQPAAARLSPKRRMVLIGAGLVLLGFFLPWFSYNPGEELSRMSGQMQQQMQGMMNNFSTNLPGGMPAMPQMPGISGGQINTPTVHISGGDIQKGLGWLVLLLGLGTAALPYAATTMDAATQRMVSFLALGIGGIVLVWLVSQNLRFLNAGVILTLAGYTVEFLGLLNPRPHVSAVPAEARV